MIILLKPAELLLRGVNRVRRALYRAGVLRGQRLPRPVIAVGNVAIGGAGKTPAVIALARHLERQGLRVAVLTRGYGRADVSITGPIDSLDAARWGDEPVLIKKNTTNVAVIVGSNRARNAIAYLSEHSVDVFLLDDGFQHLQLERDADIVIDGPARFRREGPSALRDATFIVPRSLRVTGGDVVAGKRVFAFAGLADNAQFFDTLQSLGASLAGTKSFPDHHRYTPADLAAVRAGAAACAAEKIVTTEKDAVKFPGSPEFITIGVEFVFPDDVLEAVTRIARASSSRR